jgi:hypothetical protein
VPIQSIGIHTTDDLAKQAQINVTKGGIASSLPRNADTNRVIAYGVQVKMKPHVVMIIPKLKTNIFKISNEYFFQ